MNDSPVTALVTAPRLGSLGWNQSSHFTHSGDSHASNAVPASGTRILRWTRDTMKKLILKTALLAAAMLALPMSANAVLISQDNGTVLDTNTNLIWLQNWNVNGQKDWYTQHAWAENLNFAGSSDWVLPSIGERAILVSVYGDLTRVSAFTNVQSFYYWSRTEFVPNPDYAWVFRSTDGFQNYDIKSQSFYAVAVRDGNVSPVPEPETYALMLAGLAVVGAAAKRKASRAQ